jgi:hypothetical protein
MLRPEEREILRAKLYILEKDGEWNERGIGFPLIKIEVKIFWFF